MKNLFLGVTVYLCVVFCLLITGIALLIAVMTNVQAHQINHEAAASWGKTYPEVRKLILELTEDDFYSAMDHARVRYLKDQIESQSQFTVKDLRDSLK